MAPRNRANVKRKDKRYLNLAALMKKNRVRPVKPKNQKSHPLRNENVNLRTETSSVRPVRRRYIPRRRIPRNRSEPASRFLFLRPKPNCRLNCRAGLPAAPPTVRKPAMRRKAAAKRKPANRSKLSKRTRPYTRRPRSKPLDTIILHRNSNFRVEPNDDLEEHSLDSDSEDLSSCDGSSATEVRSSASILDISPCEKATSTEASIHSTDDEQSDLKNEISVQDGIEENKRAT